MHSHSSSVKRGSEPSVAPPPDTLPAKQARSLRTVDMLLDAAEAVLAEQGLDHATVPNIARRAGLSVGVVYRRFPDKDGLLRAVYERFVDRGATASAQGLDPEQWRGVPFVETVRAIVAAVVAMHRRHRELVRALTLYAQTHPDPAFRRRAEELNAETIRLVKQLLLAHRAELRHPDPEQAIAFGMFTIAATLRAVVQSEPSSLRPFAVSEHRLGEELTRIYLGYLGYTGKKPVSRARRKARTSDR